MAIDAEDLIIQPFRELVTHGQEAIKNAQHAAHDGEELEPYSQMVKSATAIIKEGERAIQKLEPLWASQFEKHGQAFLEAITENETLSESRVAMDDLLYDFDDYVDLDKFEPERYTEIQLTAKAFARTSIETIKRLRIDKTTSLASRPATPVDQYPPSHNFPPLPPLPRIHRKAAVLQPLNSHGAHVTSEDTESSTTKTYEAQCVDCQYRQDMSRLVADMNRDVKAYYTTKGVQYRLRFLYKSHIFTNTGSIKHYACLFCSHEGYTTRPDDATVFGSLDGLFGHLARHAQPLPSIAGVKVIYGDKEQLDDGELQDCDLYFSKPTIPSDTTDEVNARLPYLPIARAIKSHNIREEEVDLVLSDGRKERPLPVFSGGRIVGVEFLEKWDGKYCVGWHDGVRGFFPSKIVELEAPPRGEVRLPGTNGDGISVKTRWKWAPKDGTIGWINFKAGDTISNVSWTFQEQWCWSGMTKNGKVGFFPQSHIKPESIRAVMSNTDSSTASIKSGNSAKTKVPSKTFALHTRGFAKKV